MGFKEKGEELYERLYDVVRCFSAKQRRIKEFKRKTNPKALTAEQIAQVKEFYKPYKIPNMVFHKYFTEKTGHFHPNYLPQDIYVAYVDPYFNDIRGSKYLDNKCYFGALFHKIPQPFTMLKRVNGIWVDHEGRSVTQEQIFEILAAEPRGVFVKEAETSAGGHGVTYFKNPAEKGKEILEVAATYPTDIIIQRELVQHPDLAAINPSSVNTYRLYSILDKDGNAKIYSSVFRVGVGDTKVDNYASGGVSVGIAEDGTLRSDGFNKKGEKVLEHPSSGITFLGYQLPSYDKAVELVKRAHPMLAHYRSVSWDIAIIEDGTPVLIEANLCRGGIDLLQLNNGPLFGDDTKKILDEVFGKTAK